MTPPRAEKTASLDRKQAGKKVPKCRKHKHGKIIWGIDMAGKFLWFCGSCWSDDVEKFMGRPRT